MLQESDKKLSYMSLFASLGCILLQDAQRAVHYFNQAKQKVAASTYWERRFDKFGLKGLIDGFPQHADDVYEELNQL